MNLGLIGAGNMASALARGIGVPVLVSDVDAERARALANELGGEALDSNLQVARRADVTVLCHKPGQLEEVAEEIAGEVQAVASILGATPTERIENAYPGVPVYRFIPNLPAEVRRGVLCYARGTRAAEGPEAEILELFERAGLVIPLEEPLIEPAMAIMSCGPAFLATVVDALADAGEAYGIEREQAARMAIETMAGTAEYLTRHGDDTVGLRRRVATPGGTTERGLQALEEAEMPRAFRAAVDSVVEMARA
jgi:pyrroline-5-carboxylate reductase